jgi:hypothetical protein
VDGPTVPVDSVVAGTATLVGDGVVAPGVVLAVAPPGVAVLATVERTLTTAERPACVGSIVQSTASASTPPMSPVVAVSPRPMAIGGSVVAHACAPISLGCRQARS